LYAKTRQVAQPYVLGTQWVAYLSRVLVLAKGGAFDFAFFLFETIYRPLIRMSRRLSFFDFKSLISNVQIAVQLSISTFRRFLWSWLRRWPPG
jgi:hypothetical protein